MNVKENLFPQKIKINVFLHKITKTSQDSLLQVGLCYGIQPPGTCHQIEEEINYEIPLKTMKEGYTRNSTEIQGKCEWAKLKTDSKRIGSEKVESLTA